MAESGFWRVTGAFSRELKPQKARGEIFLSSSPLPGMACLCSTMSLQAGRVGRAPSPPSAIRCIRNPVAQIPYPEPCLRHCWLLDPPPCLPGSLLRKARCLSCNSSRLEAYLLSFCLSPLHRCSIIASASPSLLCSSQLCLSGLVSVQ